MHKSVLKPGPDVCLGSLLFHFFDNLQYFSPLFLFEPILRPETKEERIEDHSPDEG